MNLETLFATKLVEGSDHEAGSGAALRTALSAQDPRLILLITIQTPTDDASRTEVADHQLSFVATWPFERLLSIRHEPLMLR